MEEKMTTIEQDIEKAKSIINEQNKLKIESSVCLFEYQFIIVKNDSLHLYERNLYGKYISK